MFINSTFAVAAVAGFALENTVLLDLSHREHFVVVVVHKTTSNDKKWCFSKRNGSIGGMGLPTTEQLD